jgi:hypothetical protein
MLAVFGDWASAAPAVNVSKAIRWAKMPPVRLSILFNLYENVRGSEGRCNLFQWSNYYQPTFKRGNVNYAIMG